MNNSLIKTIKTIIIITIIIITTNPKQISTYRPINDDCGGAIEISTQFIGRSLISLSSLQSSTSSQQTTIKNILYQSKNDIWFTRTPTQDEKIELQICAEGNVEHLLYRGSSCDDLFFLQVLSSAEIYSCIDFSLEFLENEKYFLVFSVMTDNVDVDLQNITPFNPKNNNNIAINDQCKDATLISTFGVGTISIDSTTLKSSSYSRVCDDQFPNNLGDVWFHIHVTPIDSIYSHSASFTVCPNTAGTVATLRLFFITDCNHNDNIVNSDHCFQPTNGFQYTSANCLQLSNALKFSVNPEKDYYLQVILDPPGNFVLKGKGIDGPERPRDQCYYSYTILSSSSFNVAANSLADYGTSWQYYTSPNTCSDIDFYYPDQWFTIIADTSDYSSLV